jgi:glycerophosphoryl diester phosphodiesterase
MISNMATKGEARNISERVTSIEANAATKDQVANIVAGISPISEDGNNLEVVDLRYGADGVTYTSAGEAVRGQTQKLADVALPFANYVVLDQPYTDDEPHVKYDEATASYTAYVPALLIVQGSKSVNIPMTEVVFTPESGQNLLMLFYNLVTEEYEVEYWWDFKTLTNRRNYAVVGTIGLRDLYLHLFTDTQKYNHYLPFVSVIMGNTINGVVESLPVFDTTKRTLTFPTDTILRVDNNYSPYFILNETSGNTVCDFSGLTTSAVDIVLDTITGRMYPIAYSDTTVVIDGKKVAVFYPRFYLVASIRTSNKRASCTFPYVCDGYFMGVDLKKYAAGGSEHVVKSINHRGYNTAPENTLAAFRVSKQNGFKYVECDVAFTADGVPVLLHDDTVDRTSNGTGNINELTYQTVQELDFGSWYSSAYTGEKIPTFQEFILLCRNLGLHPYIEIKASDRYYTEDQVKQLVDIVKRSGMTRKVTWISFSSAYLSYIMNYDPAARLGYVVNTITDEVVAFVQSLQTDKNEVFIDTSNDLLTNDQVGLCVAADIPLEVWTINDESTIRTLDPYVSGVTSDNLVAGRVLHDANI